MCAVPGCQEHYGCQLRNKGIQLSNSVTPSRTKNWRPTQTAPDPSRAAIQYDERPGGIKVPFLKADGRPLRKGEMSKRKSDLAAEVRNSRNAAHTV